MGSDAEKAIPEKNAAALDDPAVAFQRLFAGSQLSHATFRPSGQKNERGKALGSYDTHRRPPTLADYRRHLAGEVGLVIVPAREDGTCTFGMLDDDPKKYDAEDTGEYISNHRAKVLSLGLPLVYFPTKSAEWTGSGISLAAWDHHSSSARI